MVPAELAERVPMFNVLLVELLSSALNTLPALKLPVIEKGTLTVAPGQNGLPVTAPVEMVCAAILKTGSNKHKKQSGVKIIFIFRLIDVFNN